MPGTSQQVTVIIDSSTSNHPLSYWIPENDAPVLGWANGSWNTVPGDYTVHVGSSSADTPLEQTIALSFEPPPPPIPPTPNPPPSGNAASGGNGGDGAFEILTLLTLLILLAARRCFRGGRAQASLIPAAGSLALPPRTFFSMR
jgi:hypothetical protein